MSEVNPADSPTTAEAEQQEIDYSQETVEQLDERLLKGEGTVEVPDPEPETVEIAEPPAEGEPEVEAAPEGDTPEAKPDDQEPEFDEAASIAEEQRLETLKRDAVAQRQEFLIGREAGRAGHLQKQVDELRQQLLAAQQPQPTDEYQAESSPRVQPTVPDSSLQASVAELQQSDRNRGVEEEYNSFLRDNPDALGMMEQMAPSIQEQAKSIMEMNLNGQSLRKMLRMTLDGAYADAKLQAVRTAREEALSKRASQVPEKKKAKQVASVSGSGGSPAPRTRQKSVEEFTAEEADAALIREFGDGSRRRPRR